MSDQKLRLLARVIYTMPSKRYLIYMRSPQWAAKRKEHLELVDHWCEHCRIRRACQVHHWNYKYLGNEMPWDLYAVCVTCHHKLHCLVMPEPANDNRQGELFKTG